MVPVKRPFGVYTAKINILYKASKLPNLSNSTKKKTIISIRTDEG